MFFLILENKKIKILFYLIIILGCLGSVLKFIFKNDFLMVIPFILMFSIFIYRLFLLIKN